MPLLAYYNCAHSRDSLWLKQWRTCDKKARYETRQRTAPPRSLIWAAFASRFQLPTDLLRYQEFISSSLEVRMCLAALLTQDRAEFFVMYLLVLAWSAYSNIEGEICCQESQGAGDGYFSRNFLDWLSIFCRQNDIILNRTSPSTLVRSSYSCLSTFYNRILSTIGRKKSSL